PLRLLLADPIGLADHFRPWTPIFLMCVLGAVLASEWRGRGRVRRVLCAVWVQTLAAGLGIAVLRGRSLVDPDAVLFPLFSGLFGIPSLSVAVLFIIHRARSGAAAAVRGLAGNLAPWPNAWAAPASLVLLVMSAVLATAIAAPLAARIGRGVARRWSRSNPRRIAALSLIAVFVLLAAATGPVGIALAALSTIVGLVPVALRVRRVHLMAS